MLPSYLLTTLLLLAGVGVLTFVIGTGTAWLVTFYRFPGAGFMRLALILPLAMPTYIIAYTYVELLEYAGPVQTALRRSFGWTSPHDYIFPEIRSLPGAILVMSLVLYPYVYAFARSSFLSQSAAEIDVARTLGRTPLAPC